MQEIYACEKGKDAVRAMNIKLSHSKRKEQMPNFETVSLASSNQKIDLLNSPQPKLKEKKILSVDTQNKAFKVTEVISKQAKKTGKAKKNLTPNVTPSKNLSPSK